MKRVVLSISFVLCALLVGAQKLEEYAYISQAYDYFNGEFTSKKDKEKIAAANIKGYICTYKNKKYEYPWQTINYDNKGNCILSVFYNAKGKVVDQVSYSYSPEGKVTGKVYRDKNEKEFKKVDFTYDKYGNIVEESYCKNKKLKAFTMSKFDSTRVLESYYYKNGSADFNKKWVYTYNADKSKKTSVIYNSKGQVKYTWNYECKPEGQLASKHKDTTAVCKDEETDKDGNKTITRREFNEKGEPIKIVTVTNKDKKLIQYTVYGKNDVLKYKSKYLPETTACTEYITYDKKGNEKYKYEYTYDNKNNQTSATHYRKGNIISKSENQYDSNNLLTMVTFYKKDNQFRSSYKYDYTYFKK